MPEITNDYKPPQSREEEVGKPRLGARVCRRLAGGGYAEGATGDLHIARKYPSG